MLDSKPIKIARFKNDSKTVRRGIIQRFESYLGISNEYDVNIIISKR
jgi:hypothetical protein